MSTPAESTHTASAPSSEPEIVTLTRMTVALLRETVRMNAMTEYFDRAFRTFGAVIGICCAPITGPPLGVYYGMPTDTIDVGAGFPTGRLAPAADGVTGETLSGGRAARILHVGSYDALQQTYSRLGTWVTE
jgi:effector-binding domain-containing protein